MKPRHSVVNTRRGPPSETGAWTVIQTLECGHELIFIGQAAIKAREAEQRQCPHCPAIEKPKSRRQSRAGNSYNNGPFPAGG